MENNNYNRNMFEVRLRTLKWVFLFALVFAWVFSGWPQMGNFPPKIESAHATQAQLTKTYSFPSDSESWSASACGATPGASCAWASGDGSPANGSLEESETRKNKSGTWTWQLSSITWESLGVPAGSTVTAVDGSYNHTMVTCTACGTTNSSGNFLVRNSGDTATIATLETAVTYTAAAAWAARNASGAQSVGASYQASNTGIILRMTGTLATANTNGAVATMRQDEIALVITYTLPSVTVSGNAYENDSDTTALVACDDLAPNIKLIVATSTPGQYSTTCSNATGAWGPITVDTPNASTTVIAYIDGSAETYGSTVYLYSGSGNVAGLDIRASTTIAVHDSDGPIGPDFFNNWDNDDDTDLPFVFTSGQGLTLEQGSKLLIGTSSVNAVIFQATSTASTTPGGTFARGGDVQITSGSTFRANGSNISVGGLLLNFGTYTTTGTSTFTGSSKSFDFGSSNVIGNLELANSSSITASSSFRTSDSGTIYVPSGNTLTIRDGKIASTSVLSVGGTLTMTGNATTTASSTITTGGTFNSHLRVDVTVASTTLPVLTTGNGANLEIYSVSASARGALLSSGTYTIAGGLLSRAEGAGNLTIDGADNNPTMNITGALDPLGTGAGTEILTMGSGAWAVAGNVNFTGGTVDPNTSTLTVSGTGKTLTSASQSLYNATLSGTITLADNLTVSNNVILSGTVTTGSNALSLTGANKTLTGGGSIEDLTISSNASSTLSGADLTVSGTLTLTGAFAVGTGRYLTSDTTGTLTLAGTLHGAGTTTIQNSNFSTSTGSIINGNLRFDPTSGNIDMTALTTGGNVEIYNSGASSRIVAMQGSGATTTIAKALMLNAASSGNVALSATSSNAALIASTTTYLDGGAGKEEMFAGTRNWAFTADLNVSNGNFLFSSATTSIAGNYTASAASTTANSGTVVFDGTNQQTITGNATSSNGFYNLAITNTSGSDPVTSPSVIFTDAASTTNLFHLTMPGAKVRLAAGKLYTFQNTAWTNPGATLATLYSSSAGTQSTIYIPGTQDTVSYIGFKDMTCGNGTNIDASGTGNNDATGNNECIAFFVYTLSIVSAANQIFEYGQAPTAISPITVTSGFGGNAVNAGNELRIAIATSSVDSIVDMRWDTTDTTATLAGTGQPKACSNQTNCTAITYDPAGSVMIVPIDTNFAGGQTLIISDLAFANFNAGAASSSALRIFLNGASDFTPNATNTAQYVAIKGKQTLSNHAAGHETNKLAVGADTSVSNVDLSSFKLTPAGESITVSQLVFALSGVSGFATENITGATLYADYNANGEVDAGDASMMGAGSASISADTGTITFSTSFSTSTARNYILQAAVASINGGDEFFIDLPGGNITMTGATSLQTINVGGNITKIKHHKPAGTQGEIDFPPAGRAVTTGGGGGGGSTLGDDPNYSAPTDLGTTFSQWTNATNAFSSNDSSASETTSNDKQDYRDFNFNVAAGNTINGIEVKLEASGSTAAGTISVELSWDSGTSVTSSGKVTNTLSTVDTVYSLGGATDTWGRTWSASDFSNGNFRVRVIASPSSNTINLDAMQVRVYHQAGGGGGGGGGDVRAPFERRYAAIMEAISGLIVAFLSPR